MHKPSKQSFTLIELLVVIAIVGILAGIIIVSMAGATDSARIAKAKVFANSVRDAMGQNIVSEYKFDDSSSAGLDSWGGHNGTANNSPTISNSDCALGSCLVLNGTNQNISIPDNSDFNFGSQMSVLAWVKGSPAQSEKGIVSQFSSTSRSWLLATHWYSGTPDGKFEVYISDDGTNATGHYKGSSSNGIVFDNKWHLIGFSFDSGKFYIYRDGDIDKYSLSIGISSIYDSSNALEIGSWEGAFFTGSIDDVRIYNKFITAEDVRQIYMAGIKELLAKKEITRDDFDSRINRLINNSICLQKSTK
jgi:prepilin-type N-terminal cleavage/methylation domain-containing protein